MENDRFILLLATPGHPGVDRAIANLAPEFGKIDHLFDLLMIKMHVPVITGDPLTNIRVSCA